MSLREKIESKGNEIIDKKGADALDEILDSGRGLLLETDLLEEGEAEEGAKVLDLIAANKTPFIRMGKLGFARLLAYWEDDERAEARRYYLEFDASYQERRAAVHAAGDGLAAAEDAEEAAWEEVQEVLVKAGKIGFQFLLKVGARMLGLPI